MSRERQPLPVQPGRRELPDLCPYCEKPVLENTYVGTERTLIVSEWFARKCGWI